MDAVMSQDNNFVFCPKVDGQPMEYVETGLAKLLGWPGRICVSSGGSSSRVLYMLEP